MNLTGRPIYQKGRKELRRGAKPPTAAERRHMDRVARLLCIVGPAGCAGRLTLHHCGCGAGGRKDHMKVLPLCEEHHLGDDGINSLTGRVSRREWEDRHGDEDYLLGLVARLIA